MIFSLFLFPSGKRSEKIAADRGTYIASDRPALLAENSFAYRFADFTADASARRPYDLPGPGFSKQIVSHFTNRRTGIFISVLIRRRSPGRRFIRGRFL
jgi:hypothetical protein